MTDKQLKMRQLGMEASYLAACAIHGKVPENPSADMDDLYKFCKFHSITSIVAMVLEEIWKTTPADEAVMKKWRQARDKAIRKKLENDPDKKPEKTETKSSAVPDEGQTPDRKTTEKKAQP